MEIVIDTSAIIAVITGEPERCRIVELTAGAALIGPGSIPWEIGNAFSAMFKRGRLTFDESRKGFAIFGTIPIRYIEPDFINAMEISEQAGIYAYDAYFIDCATRQKSPLLTLDQKLRAAAGSMNIKVLEV